MESKNALKMYRAIIRALEQCCEEYRRDLLEQAADLTAQALNWPGLTTEQRDVLTAAAGIIATHALTY